MFCENCDAEIKDPNQSFCPNCGNPLKKNIHLLSQKHGFILINREVSNEKGIELVETYRLANFFEISVKEGKDIEMIFNKLVKSLINRVEYEKFDNEIYA